MPGQPISNCFGIRYNDVLGIVSAEDRRRIDLDFWDEDTNPYCSRPLFSVVLTVFGLTPRSISSMVPVASKNLFKCEMVFIFGASSPYSRHIRR
ncbi:hypothetical protein AVEN_188492-1 [Araneus ventricosus]|uniref:Uncharacterized protein n=1 Tax=Araneus ventricosus TaxID=182803 RepID=A0A4Y2T9X5_ARAVE|nr:hypothetical protein AVEN_188492-1 [Araneus ventricosus]